MIGKSFLTNISKVLTYVKEIVLTPTNEEKKVMGLDMNFYARKNEENNGYFYFRKHAMLHEFLMKEWCRLHENEDITDFNCIEFEITEEIFLKMKDFCENHPNKREHYTNELFWGESTEEDWENTKTFLSMTESFMKKGYTIIYEPWW